MPVVLLALLVTTLQLNRVHSSPPREKIMIEVDISGMRPGKVEIIPSAQYPGAINYIVRGNSRHTHVIGNIKDGSVLITEGDPRSMSRYVLLLRKNNGTKYLRVITRYRNNNIYSTRITEFRKRENEVEYSAVIKRPVDINLPTQEDNNAISVKLVSIPEPGDTKPEQAQSLKFSVKQEMIDEIIIGKVLFGKYILDDKRTDMVNRVVIWEGGLRYPSVTIITRYSDGNELENDYKYMDSEIGFVVESVKRKFSSLCE
ncbi:signal peptide containing protein [Theileria equi strain WA]|uniref:Signal peptide containing protein n=1 Tax=Theileria equi strain WA TaxID=1537102 RepID=L1L9D9_THEEQ|nr:signal peptide containing protein [Theileria equi strain WA]EKX72027.1 signal peptide containing protein [Theileria equi strain WA]|eukprot:XP_004831479.1 signal peptide containing protein [Theileria equi strain WA]